MTQLVARVDDELVAAVDAMVVSGAVANRSEAVRLALAQLVDRHERAQIGRAIIEGYRRVPQTDEEIRWADDATAQALDEEPW